MEDRGNEARGQAEGERPETDPGHFGVTPYYPRPGEGSRSLNASANRETGLQGPTTKQNATSWIGWQSVVYVFVLSAASLVLVPLTSLWWIVPVLGALMPIALAVLERSDPKLGRTDDRKAKERELLNALGERGETTPATAAMRTSLTVDEASKMLGDLAGKGHLKLQAEDGVMAYALPDRNRRPEQSEPSALSEPVREGAGTPKRLDAPLSERELEVLILLASGKTNAEISRDLFVAVGTVKSHVNNIYRKLDAANRAEAFTRARELNLLR